MTNLIPRITLGELDLTDYPYSVLFDYDLGAGGISYEAVVSQMLDGEELSSSRTSNRDISLTVMVEGPDLLSIAESTAALFSECDKRGNVLTVDPGDDFAAATAFDTYRAAMKQKPESLHETNGVRLFDLSIPAHPHARSVEETVQPAVAIDTSLTVIDDCSSATGWTSSEGVVGVSSGAVVFTESTGDKITKLTRSGSIDMTAEPYLVVDWKTSVPATFRMYGFAEVMREVSPFGATWVRSYFFRPDDFTSVEFYAKELPVGATTSVTQVATTGSLPDSDTGGIQQSLVIAPGGSARTQAQLEVINAGTSALGEVTIYTTPVGDAYMPSMRRWLYSSDTPTPNPTGDFQTIAGPSAYDIPASTIPVGGYMIAARLMCTTTANVKIVYSLQTLVNGVVVGDYIEESPTVSFVAGQWHVVPLGLATLPTSIVGPAGVIRLGIQRELASSAVVSLHDTFLFHEDGDLTIVECGSGTSAPGGPSRRMRILPPSAERPGGGLEMGHATDWSDAFAAGAKAVHRPARGHVLHPEGTSAFVMTPGLSAGSPAAVSATWFKRHHTHAVD